MKTRSLARVVVALSIGLALGTNALWSQSTPVAARQPLDHSAYELWRRIISPALSDNGKFAVWVQANPEADGTLHVRSLASDAVQIIDRGEQPRISEDSRYLLFLIKPQRAAVHKARRDRVKAEQMPTDSLGILDVSDGRVTRVARIRSFKVPEEAAGWVAYLLEKGPAPDTTRADSAKTEPLVGPAGRVGGRAESAQPQTSEAGAQPQAKKNEKKKEDGTTLVVRNLNTGEERRINYVTTYAFAESGARLAYTRSTKRGTGDGAYVFELGTGKTIALLEGKGDYKQVVFDELGNQVAFLTNRDDYEAEAPAFALYHWTLRQPSARAVARLGSPGLPADWAPSEYAQPTFSESGRRLFFGSAPRPIPEPGDSLADDQKVKIDVWHWQDPYLQPMQLRQADQEKRRTYRAVVHLRDGKLVQLATLDMPSVVLAGGGDPDVALGSSDLPYRQLISWDTDYEDIYVVDVRTGARMRVLEKARPARISPEGRYLYWYSREDEAWYVQSTVGGRPMNVSARIPHIMYNEEYDVPALPSAYGSPGWTTNDRTLLIYDKFDIWEVDPLGRSARNITDGVGRHQNLRFRYVRLNPEERAIDPAQSILLSAFHLYTKQDGYFRDRVSGNSEPKRLLLEDRALGQLQKAEDADVLMLTRSTFKEFPDLWVAGPEFQNMRRLSDANPQQANYTWGTAELVEWRSGEGQTLQGVLYKPDDFDPNRQYPMIVYFYEKLSDNLHSHFIPAPGGSSINISFYVSRGYLVFTPDIPYRIRYPGQSAVNSVVPGVLSLMSRGFVDPQRVGIQGHSWGGYQAAYLVTRTNMFRVAQAGAPVVNMTSAYGGIRWGTGRSRMMQYEKQQSRIGRSLWDAPMQFIENSPLFWADKIQTPVLMVHNDEDGAVPWEQSIEFFVALRRLQKPAWLLVYNGEDHVVRRIQNQKDFATRMQQFFDHYLKDTPAPVWLTEGVPAVLKGRTLGLELEQPANKPVMEEAVRNRN